MFDTEVRNFNHLQLTRYKHSIINELENLLDGIGRELRLRQDPKSNFSVVWPWPLTYWPQTLIVSSLCPVNYLCKFAAKSVYSFSKYRVDKFGNERTNGQTNWQRENIVSPASLDSRRHKNMQVHIFCFSPLYFVIWSCILHFIPLCTKVRFVLPSPNKWIVGIG